MDKKKFKQIMEELIVLDKDTTELNKSFRKLNPDFNFICFSRHESLVMKCLREAMNDNSDWIGYWFYELEQGKNAKSNSVTIGDKNVPIKTIDNLYNLITKK